MIDATYLKNIWETRYFWMHLSLSDIRFKYRRSVLGLAWAVIQPLALTLLLAFVMGHFFHSNMIDYAPFIFSGLIIWDFITTSTVNGCHAFINAGGYIKQFTHPLLIYTLRTVITSMINTLCAFIGLFSWVILWKPENIGWCWLTLFLSFPLLFLFAWPLATISAFIGTKFQDFSQLIIILLQGIYYVSPILFLPKLFISSHLEYLMEWNPIYHLLNLFRKPLLEGLFPTLNDYTFVITSIVIVWVISWLSVRLNERKIIFYL